MEAKRCPVPVRTRPVLLKTGGASIDSPAAWRALEDRARREYRPTLGLEIGEAAGDDEHFPPWTNAASLRMGLEELARSAAARRPWEALSLHREEDVWALRRRFLDGRALRRRQESELALTALKRHLQRVLGSGWRPVEIHFQHARPTNCGAHEATFNCPVLFGQQSDAIYLGARAIGTPVKGFSEARGGRRPLQSRPVLSLKGRVMAEIRAELSAGYPKLEDVAEALGTSPWTLQRRLAKQGAVFSELVDETRRELTLIYLAEQHLGLSEVAEMLGYSELSAFSRVCRRWFGAPPSRLRDGPLGQAGQGQEKLIETASTEASEWT
ncbi:helix-turn-helix transcriptional regulator [Pseudooceanicola batsensis]|nr:AraC family transcriptional regulator [Pseudooceanicola batsensis]